MRAEPVGPDDWVDWRTLRLEALQEAPQAFCRTYDETLAWTEADWRAMLGRPGGWWLVRDDGAVRAMASTWEEGGRHWLGAVYVTPDTRGQGLLDELVGRGAAWAREQGAPTLHLEVHEDNAPARAAYIRLGFTETGGRRPYPLGPGDELEMVLAL
ncbi:MAG: GNAT family N-acetyltransferase [Actinomycetes bacterium]